jgi:dihydroflavonol-4-reductase
LTLLSGKLPFAVKGGYDFVDVRDVAAGVAACAEYGLSGQGYILSGQYALIRDILEAAKSTLSMKRTVSFLPICLAGLAAPICETRSLRKHLPLYFTPYAIDVLRSNSRFSREKAEAVLRYAPRPVKSSIRDTVLWLRDNM